MNTNDRSLAEVLYRHRPCSLDFFITDEDGDGQVSFNEMLDGNFFIQASDNEGQVVTIIPGPSGEQRLREWLNKREALRVEKRRFIRRDRSPDHAPGDRMTRAIVAAMVNPDNAHEYAKRMLEEAENAPAAEQPEPIVHSWDAGQEDL